MEKVKRINFRQTEKKELTSEEKIEYLTKRVKQLIKERQIFLYELIKAKQEINYLKVWLDFPTDCLGNTDGEGESDEESDE